MSAAGTLDDDSNASGEFSVSEMNSSHSLKDWASQRSLTKSRLINPSVAITWASALITATFVPGINCKW